MTVTALSVWKRKVLWAKTCIGMQGRASCNNRSGLPSRNSQSAFNEPLSSVISCTTTSAAKLLISLHVVCNVHG